MTSNQAIIIFGGLAVLVLMLLCGVSGTAGI